MNLVHTAINMTPEELLDPYKMFLVELELARLREVYGDPPIFKNYEEEE